MNDLIPVLSNILPIVATTLLVLVITLNFYVKIRRKFPFSANCWFCNSWTKVSFDDRNSFYCPTCLQYNGFTKDGDYNKILPEQHDELMNKSTRFQCNKSQVANGLCTLCNNNQRLKIIQLAKFVPMVEENYDREIEHFQKQLEKAYKLCKKCDRHLKNTIEKQGAWIFGKHVKNICTNGFSSLNKITTNLRPSKQATLARLINFLSIFLAAFVLFVAFASNKMTSKYIPKGDFKNLTLVISRSNVLQFFPVDLPKIRITPYSVACFSGLLFRLGSFFAGNHGVTVKMNQLLCWTILLLLSWMKILKDYAAHILVAQIFCCMYLLYSSHATKPPPNQKKRQKSAKKLPRNPENSCSEFSDFEDISTSSKKLTTSSSSSQDSSSNYLNLSTSSQKSQFVPSTFHNTANSVLNTSLGVGTCNSNFSTASVLSDNFSQRRNRRMSVDLHKSLDNLHLGFVSPGRTVSPVFSVTSVMQRPRPVLSPAKFLAFNQNPWVAGGFWKNDAAPAAQRTNLSRSSSESSGFGSQNNEVLNSGGGNYFTACSEYDKNSLPDFHNPQNNVFYRYGDGNFAGTNGLLSTSRFFQPIQERDSAAYEGRKLFKNWSEVLSSVPGGFKEPAFNLNQ